MKPRSSQLKFKCRTQRLSLRKMSRSSLCLLPQGEQTLYIKASDGYSFAQANSNISWSSVYEALKGISLDEPLIIPAEYGKGTDILVTVALNVPKEVRPEDLKQYLEHIKVSAKIAPAEKTLLSTAWSMTSPQGNLSRKQHIPCQARLSPLTGMLKALSPRRMPKNGHLRPWYRNQINQC